jgi:hypothetical protein
VFGLSLDIGIARLWRTLFARTIVDDALPGLRDMTNPDVGRRVFIKGAACGGLALAGGIALFNPTRARAQGAELTWPNRPVRFIARLNAELDKGLADPATRKTLQQTATEPVGGAPEQLARVVQSDSAKYARLVKELNIRAN